MLGLDEARTAIRREMRAALDDLPGLDEKDWARPTRCAGWTVRDLVAHLVWGQRLEGQGIAALETGRTTPEEVPPPPTSEGAVLVAELAEAHEALAGHLAARTTAELDRPVPMPYGQVPLALMLQLIAMEEGIHRNDLDAALGRPCDLAPDVVEAALALIAGFLPVLAAAGTRPAEPVSYRLRGQELEMVLVWDGDAWFSAMDVPDQPVDVTIEGSDSDLCLFLFGRLGLDDAPFKIEGDPVLAYRLKEYVPGP